MTFVILSLSEGLDYQMCRVEDDNECFIKFTIFDNEYGEAVLEIEEEPSCPKPVNIPAIVGAVVASIVLIGLLLLLVWKLLTYIHDTREFAKFEKERQNAKWDTVSIPRFTLGLFVVLSLCNVGPDNIPIEVFAVLEDIGIDFLTKLLNSIYDSGKIPKDLAKSVFITLPKIPGTMDCELHRTISLMSHLTKVLLRIIMARMRKSLRPEMSQLQFGFVPDKSTRNAIFTLSMLAERCIEMQKDLYLCFIDYSKAFDKVRHEKLFNILEHLDIDGKDLRVIRNLYWDQSAAVRIGGELSEYTLIKRGVRQGCVMSPDLFNIYSEMIFRNLENYPGVKINGENINNIRYADDTVLIADSEENLQRLLDITIEKSEEMGLTLNVKKTECMVISKKAIIPSCNLQSRGQQIKLVKKFKYLGYMITSDGKCITEIKKRIATAKDAFQKLSLILKNRNISMTTKFRVLKTYVWSTLTYGCECWTITSDIEKKIEAAEMWFIRRMLRISWTEKKTNVNVLREGNVQRSLLKTIRKR